MDIITNHSEEKFYKIPNDVGAVLISCGLVRQLVPAKPVVKPAEWMVVRPPSGETADWCIQHCVAGVMTYYGGPTDKAKDGFKTLVWNGAEGKRTLQGPEPPMEILQQFARARDDEKEAQRLALVAAERLRNPQSIEESQRRQGRF